MDRYTGLVPAYCTCGAELLEGSRFCHKCGKPQFEPPPPEPIEAEPLPVIPAEPALPPVSFHNPAAVRTALLAALISYLLISFPVPLPIIWPVIALLAAGVLAVYLYQRRTGQTLDVAGGARMGWITGIFTFAIATVFFTLGVFLISQQGGLSNFYREHLPGLRAGDPNIEKVLEFLQNPTGLGIFLFLSLGVLFVLFTVIPTVGGVLGAKVFERDQI